MHIVGTAGHVDHGKSTLVAALTGTNPDRLKEEIAREMTIDLGFASMKLPNGEQIGIIDVPGHRDFIANMLSGIGSIDAAMLIIAADEGVSNQTLEHLDILNLLEIHKGVVVLTKTDLVSDPEWLNLVEMEAYTLISTTSLANAPIVRVSAKTSAGLDQLLITLQEVLSEIPPKPDLGRPRLPVDRVFSLTGFGTIVTGTLLDGSFSLGEEVIALPGGARGRIRGLQNHKQKLQSIHPGFRTAINLSGIEKDQITRGEVIAHPGTYQPTTLLDAYFHLLDHSPVPVKHNLEVKLFIGAAETTAQLRLLGVEALAPGDSAFIQLKLLNPVVAVRGDHYILRLPSPSATLGGGMILDPHPARLHRRFSSEALGQLEKLRSGSEAELLIQAAANLEAAPAKEIVAKSGLETSKAADLISDLLDKGVLVRLPNPRQSGAPLVLTTEFWTRLRARILAILNDFHKDNPLKAGLTREQLRAQLRLNPPLFDAALIQLAAEHMLRQWGAFVALTSHQINLTPSQEAAARSLLKNFDQSPYSPPDLAAATELVGSPLLEGLIAAGRLVPVSDQILLTPQALEDMTSWVSYTLSAKDILSLAEFRDHFQTSRKYATAVLEYLDSIGVTVRKGDFRILKRVK